MLTREQVSIIAKKYNIGFAVQERDYIQSVFLYLLSRETQGLCFKGGTCLRMVHNLNRFSEDLDFNFVNDKDKVRSLFLGSVDNLRTFGIEAKARDKRFFQSWFSFDLSFQGPLFDGASTTKNKIKVDVSMREEEVEIEKPLIDLTHTYPDIPVFSISCLALSHILAEKIRALLVRGKPRDLYDVWFLLRKNVHFDIELVNRKLALYALPFSEEKLFNVINRMEAIWKRDLSALLPAIIEFADIRRTVIEQIRKGNRKND